MKKYLMLTIFISFFLITFVVEANAEENYYIYRMTIADFDEYLDQLHNMNYIETNAEKSYLNEYGVIEARNEWHIRKSDIAFLYDQQNIKDMLLFFNCAADISEYKIFSVYDERAAMEMPLTIWLNTTEGIKFITIDQPNFLEEEKNYTIVDDMYKIGLYNSEAYREKCALKPATVYYNGTEVPMHYAAIRYKGAYLSLRSLLENFGASVMWNEENDSVIFGRNDWKYILKVGDEYPNRLLFYDYNNNDYTVELDMWGASSCKWVDDRIVVDYWQGRFLLTFVNEENMLSDIKIDNENSRIDIFRWPDTEETKIK